MDNEIMAAEFKKVAIAIRSTSNLVTLSWLVPPFIIFSIPLTFVAIHRRKKVLQNPDMSKVLSGLDHLKLKDLHKQKKEDSLEGSAALFLIHKNKAFNGLLLLLLWGSIIIGVLIAVYIAEYSMAH